LSSISIAMTKPGFFFLILLKTSKVFAISPSIDSCASFAHNVRTNCRLKGTYESVWCTDPTIEQTLDSCTLLERRCRMSSRVLPSILLCDGHLLFSPHDIDMGWLCWSTNRLTNHESSSPFSNVIMQGQLQRAERLISPLSSPCETIEHCLNDR
jgi:hypothetical protein